jgi:hypothetical protein
MHRSLLLRISSADRKANESYNKFTVHMGSESPEIQAVKKVTLSTLIFNNNHYNINPSNNLLSYKLNGQDKSLAVPPGFYTTTTLVAALSVLEPLIVITQDAVTGRLVFTNPDFQLFSESESTQSTLSPHLGITTTSLPNSVSVSADTIPDLNGLDLIFIKSSKLAQGNLIDSDENNHNYLASIPVVATFGTNNVYYETHVSEVSGITYKAPKNLSNIDIELVDHRHRPVYLQSDVILILKIYH